MPLDPDTIAQQRYLLARHRRTLAHLLREAARFSAGHTPAHIANGIAETRANISRVKAYLRENDVSVEDEPNDEASLAVFTILRHPFFPVLAIALIVLLETIIFAVFPKQTATEIQQTAAALQSTSAALAASTQVVVTSAPIVIVATFVVTSPTEVVTSLPYTPSPTYTPIPLTPLPVPTVVVENVEAEWPPKMQLKQSDEVRVSLVYTTGHALVPVIEVPGHTAIIGTPIPVGTPGPFAAALGPDYDTFISAKLGGVAFEIVPATNEEYRLLGPSKVTWIWNIIPKYRGSQVLDVSVDVRWEPKDGIKPVRYQVWRKRLETYVDAPLVEIGDPIQITPILTAAGGAAFAWLAPRIYKWARARKRPGPRRRQR